MSTTTVHVQLDHRSYDIEVGSGLLATAGPKIASWRDTRFGPSSSGTACIVCDKHVLEHSVPVVRSLQQLDWKVVIYQIEPGEKSKCQAVIDAGYDVLVDLPADRRTVIIAIGGGVTGDTAGFLAASFNRGLPFVQIPTTLLADVDSSVGGKVGINHPRAKNLIGAFHQPLGVLIDTAVLRTLPDREYLSGLAEVIKYGVIMDASFFAELEQLAPALLERQREALQRVIAHSCRLKADVVEQDEFERTGLRAILNYGHTFAHAFEALCGYGELLHGEAVSIGMMYAARLAERLGRVDQPFVERQRALLQACRLPTSLPSGSRLAPADLLACMRLDKKTVGGKLRFVLPTRLGHVELVGNVDEQLVQEVLVELAPPAS
jgi:3-dehydroquinate synthase